MDPGVPSVPITTLAGVASLTDLLPEMPLPTPSPQTLSNKSLLFHPRVAEEAQNLLGVRDEVLIPQLVQSLEKTSAEHIEVKDNYAGTDSKLEQQESMPEILRALLDSNPYIFYGNKPHTAQTVRLVPLNRIPQTQPSQSLQTKQQESQLRPQPAQPRLQPPQQRLQPLTQTPQPQQRLQNQQQTPTHQQSQSSQQQSLYILTTSNSQPASHVQPQTSHLQPQPSSHLQPQPKSKGAFPPHWNNTGASMFTVKSSTDESEIRQAAINSFNHQQPIISPNSRDGINNLSNSESSDLTSQKSTSSHDLDESIMYLTGSSTSSGTQQRAAPPHEMDNSLISISDDSFIETQTRAVENTEINDTIISISSESDFGGSKTKAVPQGQSKSKDDFSIGTGNTTVIPSNLVLNQKPIMKPSLHDQSILEAAQPLSNTLTVNNFNNRSTQTSTSELRQLRRNPARGQQADNTKNTSKTDTPPTIPVTMLKQNSAVKYDSKVQSENIETGTEKPKENKAIETNEIKITEVKGRDSSDVLELDMKALSEAVTCDHSIKQPIIKLYRLSSEDQALLLKSIKEFIEKKPKMAKDMGIHLLYSTNNEDREDYQSDEDLGNKRKRSNRKHIGSESDEDYEPDTFSALVGSKRRKIGKDEVPEPVIVKPKLRRVEKKFVPVLEKLSQEELMETNTYHKFNKSIEYVLRSGEDIDASDIGDDGTIQEEYLLSRSVMQELCTEAAKLKILGAMEMIPTDKLTRLLNILELNIRGGDRVSPISDEDNESIRQLWLEAAMERVMGAADACLVCMYIMTSRNMSKRVYLEEVIDRVVLYIKYQLHNTIFPSFDSTYRLDNKKKDGRRKKNTQVSEKGILVLYTKISELVNLLAELLNIQILTDTSVLHASSMGVSPFFAENVSELQLACLKLVTTIFTKYETHRRLLLDDILASIARLPSTKRSLRTYRINSEEHIQMLTALVLQLIQCVVALPDNFLPKESKDKSQTVDKNTPKIDTDIFICNKYEKATSTAGTFLTVFLNKCGNKQEDIDYRPLFENFVQDLLSTVNKPEWPATELLLCLLGKMLVKNFSNKGTDMSLRVASLDYLGVVAAKLRKDSVLSRCKLNTIDQMIKDIKQEEQKDNEEKSSKNKKKKNVVNTDNERAQFLQRVLLDFLAVNAQNDEAYKYARHFYIAQWYKDAVTEKSQLAMGDKNNSKDNSHRSRKYKDDEDDEDSDEEKMKNRKSSEQENTEIFAQIEEKKKFLLSKIKPFQESISAGNRVQVFQTYIDYSSAELIAQFLASKRYFSQSFDQYLKAILIVLKETSIAIRTKAMKCLTMIVEADPSVLGRHDMQIGVNLSFLDHSTSVREAAVDLVGKFVLSRPELINKYYEMLSARILDTGVSVRKRVIKILKDICIECPEFPKVPEICVKMIRRVNDEEGIRKLVMEVFQNMWFTPTKDTSLLRKVMNITDVVASSEEIGLEWFEQLLLSLFKPKEDKDDSTKVMTEPPKALLLACRQIVDCLIENVLSLEETSENTSTSQRLAACLTTLYLFAKIRPQLLVKHASTLQPYLGLKCQTKGDIQIISSVAKMLELVVPLMEHPSDSFLAQLEEDALKLALQYNRPIVSSCLSCLGSIINKVTRNYKLIRDCFKTYYEYLKKFKEWIEKNLNVLGEMKGRATFRRSLFIVGLLLKHFDFKDPEVLGDLTVDLKNEVYQIMIFFLRKDDTDIQVNTLKAIGCICIRHYEFMLENELKTFYHQQLTMEDAPLEMKVEVLTNIESYLIEEENRMIQQDLEWSKRSKQENLKEMGDVSSGMASTVIQLYLKEIMESYLHPSFKVRHPALRVIQLVLQQGLVHPVQIVPYLICMSTDCEKVISYSADKQLSDIEKKYPGFIHTKSSFAIRLSYQLQEILQGGSIVRGSRVKEKGEYPSALNGYLYSILRSSRQQRRALILNILKQFDEQARTTLSYMLYLADNMAYFPYQVQDEPLFIVHHIDIMISLSGTNLLQNFRDCLMVEGQTNKIPDTENSGAINVVSALDEDDDDEESLLSRVPEDTSQLQAYITAAQGCLLLLMLKQHIKDVYGLSDGKIQQYSPSEPAKVYEKAITRRSNALFNPKATIQKLKEGKLPEYLDEDGRRDLIRQYIDFKQLMLRLDPDDPDDDENAPKLLTALANTQSTHQTNTGAPSSILTEADQVVLDNYKDSPPKVPKLVISNRRFDSDTKRTARTQKSEKVKKHRHKKKRRKFASSSGEESENDYSDPDFMA
ncbi:nipped-B-like protein B [Diorhabda carinulata]|uniref:nipped-B-like protein B n=1 Tax=Diorhabda carinulata TaxID=1163345 RepID=UPI0025A2B284|nr:nipped-B-like protein B [Diorhabda carinulata]